MSPRAAAIGWLGRTFRARAGSEDGGTGLSKRPTEAPWPSGRGKKAGSPKGYESPRSFPFFHQPFFHQPARLYADGTRPRTENLAVPTQPNARSGTRVGNGRAALSHALQLCRRTAPHVVGSRAGHRRHRAAARQRAARAEKPLARHTGRCMRRSCRRSCAGWTRHTKRSSAASPRGTRRASPACRGLTATTRSPLPTLAMARSWLAGCGACRKLGAFLFVCIVRWLAPPRPSPAAQRRMAGLRPSPVPMCLPSYCRLPTKRRV
jgi:hypothetical protein